MADDNTFDLTGLKCPMPIVKLNKIMKTLAANDECTVTSDDPAFKPDVEAWCNKTGHALLHCIDDGGKIVAMIRKQD
ncbi:MAG: sulfurtransferase TusA family protein [Gammaproteobacteria bacterium]|nr:sulfurtransferase TusA family protein [Phycisphaerales bacterium]MCB1739597.1 sulfurtransferase TusA family protein [Gammaproteobacteria bacterium]